MDYVDNNGKFPWLVIIAVVGTGLLLTGCSAEETTISAESVELPMPTPIGYEFEHPEEEYNNEHLLYTNCYAFAMDMVEYPDEDFSTRYDNNPNFAMQPGYYSGQSYDSNEVYVKRHYESLINAVTADGAVLGC